LTTKKASTSSIYVANEGKGYTKTTTTTSKDECTEEEKAKRAMQTAYVRAPRAITGYQNSTAANSTVTPTSTPVPYTGDAMQLRFSCLSLALVMGIVAFVQFL